MVVLTFPIEKRGVMRCFVGITHHEDHTVPMLSADSCDVLIWRSFGWLGARVCCVTNLVPILVLFRVSVVDGSLQEAWYELQLRVQAQVRCGLFEFVLYLYPLFVHRGKMVLSFVCLYYCVFVRLFSLCVFVCVQVRLSGEEIRPRMRNVPLCDGPTLVLLRCIEFCGRGNAVVR